MKALKKQWLTLVMLAALIATLTLGVVFAFPAHGAVAEAADEDVFANAAMITVSTEQDLKAQVAQADETPMVIQLGENIEMKTLNEETGSGYELVVGRGQAIKLDLNGKTLSVPAKNNSEGYVIVNKGTLSVVDTSEDYQGAVISNGYVSNTNAFEESKDGEIYWWPSKAVVNNYGDLTLDAKLSIQIPQSGGSNDSFNTNAYYFVGSWKGERTYEAKSYLVRNQIDITSYEEDQTVTRASLTVDGGVYDLAYNKLLGNALGIYYTMNHFFLLSEADLTVNGGTFSYSSPFYNSAYFDGFLAELISLEQQTPEIEAQIKEYRHIDITITDGDFGNEKLSKELLYMDASGQWNKDYKYDASIEGESCSIAVSGGVFPMDLSVYTDAAHRMKKGDDGFYSVIPLEDDYIQEYAVAKIELDGEKPTLSGYFDTFDGAWNAVQTRAQTGQSVILTLLKDVESQSLLFEQASGDIRITIDLNGHELKVTQDSMYNTHIRENNVGEDSVGVRTLVVRDTSEKQDGTFNLVYLKDVSNGGISISPKLKFVLESGTITRTGGGFYESPDGWGSTSQNQRSIFYLASIDSSTETLVTIKGGNILSELEGDNGHLISTSQDNFKDAEYFNLETYAEFIKPYLQLSYTDEETVGMGYRYSWNVSPLLPDNYKCVKDTNTNIYYVSRVGEEKYLVGTTSCNTLADAIRAAKENTDHTILMVAPDTLTEGITLDGVTLDLNPYQNFTLVAPTVTLTGGAVVKNGAIQGNVVVQGSASFENFEMTGELNVKSTAELEIAEGTYNGNITVEDGAAFSISGGSFKGSQVSTVEKNTLKYYGMFKLANETFVDDQLYPVQVAPNAAARNWYTSFVSGGYIINNVTAWNNFALFVSSGADVFSGKMIKLGADLKFDQELQTARLASTATEPNFLPAGTNAHRFAGSFDGQNHTMSGIYAQELNVGLFGATAYGSYVRVMNLTVKDSSFLVGKGTLDAMNTNATLAGGAIIGEGHLDAGQNDDQWSGNITLNNVKVGYDEGYSTSFNGGLVGHSWGSISIDGLKFQNATTVSSSWKKGGVVGYLEGNFYIKKADIEVGTDGNPNGLILEGGGFFEGALIGHANGSNNTIENCTILEPNDSLIGTTYAGGANSTVTIKGEQTDLDIYQVVGEGRGPKSQTVVEITGNVTEEDGVQKGSFQTQKKEEYLKFYEVVDGERNDITDEIKESSGEGGYSAKAELVVDVTIGGLAGTITYAADNTPELTVTSFTLFDTFGNPVDADLYGEITVKVTLRESDYNVGKHIALITSYTVEGADPKEFNILITGNQTFIELEVQAAMLTVSVNQNGEVVYDGFVGGENESVLGGELILERVDNGDGTMTVTPSGLTSENYNIVYVSGVVAAPVATSEAGNTVLIVLLSVGAAALILTAAALVVTLRKKQN